MSKDRDTIVLSDKKVTTRRRFEMMTVDESRLLTERAIKEVDEAAEMVDGAWIPDGEMHIEILVTQRMKRDEKCTACGSKESHHLAYVREHGKCVV